MKITCRVLLALVGLGLAGCGRAPETATKNAEQAPAVDLTPGTPESPREVKIEVGDSMKFSVTRFEAAAGETVRLLLVNTGSAPKEAMGHNWVLLRAGADATAYANAAVGAKATDYLPAARAGDVIAHTKLIGGKSRDAVVFTVPADAAPGTELVYLCTFPAHLQLGMKGVLVVK
jgi:azurin